MKNNNPYIIQLVTIFDSQTVYIGDGDVICLYREDAKLYEDIHEAIGIVLALHKKMGAMLIGIHITDAEGESVFDSLNWDRWTPSLGRG